MNAETYKLIFDIGRRFEDFRGHGNFARFRNEAERLCEAAGGEAIIIISHDREQVSVLAGATGGGIEVRTHPTFEPDDGYQRISTALCESRAEFRECVRICEKAFARLGT
jgi:hypothetical protein